jgi:threonine/homoserine/homoserine lactone efflux protein
MLVYLFIEGILIGILVAVPVGPLGLLCINRSLAMGALCGLFSGLGVASADALAAGIAALGITLISSFLIEHETALRLVGGIFLFYLGCKIYRTRPGNQLPPSKVGGLFSAYATTFLLTFSNPVTIVSFVAIYAGWGLQSLRQHYLSAAVLTAGVFAGSALWWILVFAAMTLFRDAVNARMMGLIHRVSGTIIAVFGLIVLLSLSPLRAAFGFQLF